MDEGTIVDKIVFKKSNERERSIEEITNNSILNKSIECIEQGKVMYKSDHLQVTKTSIEGYVMKAVENLGFFNKAEYHKRYFVFEFGTTYCHFFEKKNDKKAHRS